MNKIIKNAAIGLCSIILGLSMTQPVTAATFIQCDNYVNMHSQAYLESTVVGHIPNDSIVQSIEDEKEGWIKINSGGVQGWINKKYIVEDDVLSRGYTVAKIHPESLAVYAAPDKNSTRYTTVYQNQEVECVQYKNNWLTLAFEDGSYGFIDAYEAELKTYYQTAKPINNISNSSTPSVKTAEKAQQDNDDSYKEENQEEDFEYVNNNEEEQIVINTKTSSNEEQIEYNNQEEDEEIEYQEQNDQTVSQIQQEEEYEQQIEELTEEQIEELEKEQSSSNSNIVDYANQFVGNPYVYGGNSLTDGIDCSHFVYQVLKDTGHYSGDYAVSDDWVDKGDQVSSLDEAEAGDVIVYSGHVAIYDGQGGIVEAKGSKYGITHDRDADCKDIVSIRHFD